MTDLPLTGIRILDAVPGPLAAIARFLGELGAEVIRVALAEPRDLATIAANLGKAAAPPDRLTALAADADILLEADPSLDIASLRRANPALVVVSISPFGRTGPWADLQASDAVLQALTGGLSRSGLPDRPPLLPPRGLIAQTAAPQIAVVTLAAYIRRLRTGEGDRLDVTLIEAGMQALDPGYGLNGSAQSGVPLWKMARGRKDERFRYPILRCADGHVRLCVLAPRQWRGMFAWMGEPAEFAGREWENIMTRFRSTTLLPAIERFFSTRTRAQIEAEAEGHGVPAAALLSLDEAVATPQMKVRHAFAEVEITPGGSLPFPNGTIEIDGARAGIRGPVSAIDPNAAFTAPRPAFVAPPPADYPLAGLKVLDLGVIVVGGESGRLFADLGADVIKVENGAFPDGQRQSLRDDPVSLTFAAGHRNKRGLSIDLKSDRGKALFLDLVRQADVIFSNFKPGTLANLGFDNPALAAANPQLVSIDSSAFGPTGPWSSRLGYGPLVRASAGLSKEWVYPGEPESFSDTITVYPDHVAARIGVAGALALLIRRMRTGAGGVASVSQAEVMLGHRAAEIAARAAAARGLAVDAAAAEEDVLLACAGDDDYCVVTLRGEADRVAFATLTGVAPEAWAQTRTPDEAMAQLQAAGIPAGAMLRITDLPASPGYQALGTFREVTHPLIATPFIVEGALTRFERVPVPDQRPAPRIGEDSIGVLEDWLGLSDADIAPLVADKIIEQAA